MPRMIFEAQETGNNENVRQKGINENISIVKL